MADLEVFDGNGPSFKNKNFKKSVQQAIQSIQNENREPYESSNRFWTKYGGTCEGVDTKNGDESEIVIGIYIGKLFPDDFRENDLFQLSPKEATNKLFDGDNYIDFEFNISSSPYTQPVVIDAGKGDDFLEYDAWSSDVQMKGGKGDDIFSFWTRDYVDDEISNPRLTGGKGDDAFVYRSGCAVITDYEPGKDVLAIDTYGRWFEHQTKSRAIDGDLFIFNRRSREPMFVLEDIDNINQVTFVPADTL